MPALINPAALIETDGEPQFVPVNATALLRVKNTTAVVFKEPTDQEIYVRLPQGWFRAWTTNGPWERVPNNALPADLAHLPGMMRTTSGTLADMPSADGPPTRANQHTTVTLKDFQENIAAYVALRNAVVAAMPPVASPRIC